MGEGRRLGGITGVEPDLAPLDALQHIAEAVDVDRLVKAVMDGLADKWMLRQFDVAGDVLLAGDQSGKDGGHQVVRTHPLERRRRALAAALPDDREGTGGVPAPARGEHRHGQQRLGDGVFHRLRPHEREHVLQGKAVLRADGEEDGVVAGRRL